VIPSLQAGGMERVMSELAWSFSAREDVELHLVLYGISRETFYSIPADLHIHKPTFKFSNRFRIINTFISLALCDYELEKLIRNFIQGKVLNA